MNANYKIVFLSVVIVFLFASIYTSVGLGDAQASKHTNKINSAKAKKGLLAQKAHPYLTEIKMGNKTK